MPALAPLPHVPDRDANERWFAEVAEGLAAGRLAPYLGPGLTAIAATSVPASYEALAAFLESKVPLPRRTRGNLWAAAQYIESQRHRSTLVSLLGEAFATPVAPLPFHRHLAALALPLIVDTWYDGALRAALADRADWGEFQGITRATIGEDGWTRAYDAAGALASPAAASDWRTVVYKPHGGVVPARNFLAADSDYVETLTEIDIQTPIPEAVKARRAGVGFVFIGCRFHDQLLRNYARQIAKRSRGPHYVVVDPAGLTRNEQWFVDQLQMRPLVSPLGEALGRLMSPGTTGLPTSPRERSR
jgi:hypothetical protein